MPILELTFILVKAAVTVWFYFLFFLIEHAIWNRFSLTHFSDCLLSRLPSVYLIQSWNAVLIRMHRFDWVGWGWCFFSQIGPLTQMQPRKKLAHMRPFCSQSGILLKPTSSVNVSEYKQGNRKDEEKDQIQTLRLECSSRPKYKLLTWWWGR